MAPGIHLEPETFYLLKSSSGLYLGGTDFEGILGVSVTTLNFFVFMVIPEEEIMTLLPWGTQFSYTFFIPVYKHFFQTSEGMLFFVILKVFPIIHFLQAVRNCHLIILKMEYPLEVLRSLLCNLAWVKQLVNNCTFYLSVWMQSCPSEHLKLLVSQAFKDYYSIVNLWLCSIKCQWWIFTVLLYFGDFFIN